MTSRFVALQRVGVVIKIRKKHSITFLWQYEVQGFNGGLKPIVPIPSTNIPDMRNGVHTWAVTRPLKNVDVLICKKLPCTCCSMRTGAVMHQHPKLLMKEWMDQHKPPVSEWNRIPKDVIIR